MSEAQPIVRMLFLRHGKTNYTGTFPDLTPEGLAHVREVAERDVCSWIARYEIEHKNLAIVTSPAPRAHGTAWEVAKRIGHPKRLNFANELGPMLWRDPKRALESLLPLRGKGYIQYEDEPVFRKADVFETPPEVRYRWYRYFGDLVRLMVNASRDAFAGPPSAKHVIVVSHYEVLCNVARDIFGIVASEEDALRHAEPIMLSVTPSTRDRNEVFITGEFRGRNTDVFIFHTRDLTLRSGA